MRTFPLFRRPLPVALLLLVTLVAAFGAIALTGRAQAAPIVTSRSRATGRGRRNNGNVRIGLSLNHTACAFRRQAHWLLSRPLCEVLKA